MKVIGTSAEGNPLVELTVADRQAIVAAGALLASFPVLAVAEMPPVVPVATKPAGSAVGGPRQVEKQGRACEICGKPVKSKRAKVCSENCTREKARRDYHSKYSPKAKAAALPGPAPKKQDQSAKAARLAAIRAAAARLDPVNRIEAQAARLKEEEG